MKPLLSVCGSMLAVFPLLWADEAPVTPDVTQESAVTAAVEAAPVISSQTVRVVREEPAPLPGMIPVRKEVEVTVQRISDPHLPEPPVPPAATYDPESIARLKALAALMPQPVIVHLSATVYDHQRTHLRWYCHVDPKRRMEAWSSLDFTDFAGVHSVIRDGVEYDFSTLGLGLIDTEDTEHGRRIANRLGILFQEPEFPELPAPGTPYFVVTKGDASDAAALAPIQVLHDLYQTDGARLHAEKLARQKANAEREAWLRAHPPEPQDVLIRVWKIAPPEARTAPLGDVPVTQP